MYNKLISLFEVKDNPLHNEFIRLYIPEIITMLALSFVTIFDKVIANKMGTEVLAGISMAAGYAELMLLFSVAVRCVANTEYTKSKNLELLGTFHKLSVIVQILITIVTIIGGSLLTYKSGLSDESKFVAHIALWCYGVNHLLLEYNRFYMIIAVAHKMAIQVSKMSIITTVLHVVLDICVFKFNMPWVWVLLDNIVAEAISVILVRRVVGNRKMVYGKLNTVLKYKDALKATLVDSGAKRILYVSMPFILSWLGDVKYARYSIIRAIINQLITCTWAVGSMSVILLNDNYKWEDVKKTIYKVTYVYALFGGILSIPLCMLFGDVKVNYTILAAMSFIKIIGSTSKCMFSGLARYYSLYKQAAIAQMSSTFGSLIWLAFAVFITRDEYVSYAMWLVVDVITVSICNASYKKNISKQSYQNNSVVN